MLSLGDQPGSETSLGILLVGIGQPDRPVVLRGRVPRAHVELALRSTEVALSLLVTLGFAPQCDTVALDRFAIREHRQPSRVFLDEHRGVHQDVGEG